MVINQPRNVDNGPATSFLSSCSSLPTRGSRPRPPSAASSALFDCFPRKESARSARAKEEKRKRCHVGTSSWHLGRATTFLIAKSFTSQVLCLTRETPTRTHVIVMWTFIASLPPDDRKKKRMRRVRYVRAAFFLSPPCLVADD